MPENKKTISVSDLEVEGIIKPKKIEQAKSVIHTMPDYFREGKNKKKFTEVKKTETGGAPSAPVPKKLKIILVISGIFAVVVVSGYFGYLFYMNYQKSQAEEAERLEQIEFERERQLKEAEKEQTTAEEARKQEEEAKKQAEAEAQRKERDETRVKDIHNIQVALEFFFEDMKTYPKALPDSGAFSFNDKVYIEEMPQNPTPGGIKYLYTVKEDSLDYELKFALEQELGQLSFGENKVTSTAQLSVDAKIVQRSSKRKAEDTSPNILLSSLDSDEDGVTDIEEDIYKSNKNEFDSDFDTYSDKQELLNLYNPFGNAPAHLIDSEAVAEFKNPTYGYSIFHIADWIVKALDDTNREIMFISNTGEFVEVIYEENPEKLTLDAWYAKQFPDLAIDSALKISTKQGYQGVKSYDRRTSYIVTDKGIYTVTHNVGNKELVDFGVTYEMMVRSLFISDEIKTELDESASSESAENQSEGDTAEETAKENQASDNTQESGASQQQPS